MNDSTNSCEVDDTEQTVQEQAAERFVEGYGGLSAAAKAGSVLDHVRMLHAHARRVHDSHKAGMSLLGFEVADPPEDEEMSITVTGDNHYHVQPQPPAPQPTPTPQVIQTAKQKLWPLITAAALASLGSGLGGVGLAALLMDREPSTTEQTGADTDTQYELRISSGDEQQNE